MVEKKSGVGRVGTANSSPAGRSAQVENENLNNGASDADKMDIDNALEKQNEEDNTVGDVAEVKRLVRIIAARANSGDPEYLEGGEDDLDKLLNCIVGTTSLKMMLIKNGDHAVFLSLLSSANSSIRTKSKCASVLAVLCNRYHESGDSENLEELSSDVQLHLPACTIFQLLDAALKSKEIDFSFVLSLLRVIRGVMQSCSNMKEHVNSDAEAAVVYAVREGAAILVNAANVMESRNREIHIETIIGSIASISWATREDEIIFRALSEEFKSQMEGMRDYFLKSGAGDLCLRIMVNPARAARTRHEALRALCGLVWDNVTIRSCDELSMNQESTIQLAENIRSRCMPVLIKLVRERTWKSHSEQPDGNNSADIFDQSSTRTGHKLGSCEASLASVAFASELSAKVLSLGRSLCNKNSPTADEEKEQILRNLQWKWMALRCIPLANQWLEDEGLTATDSSPSTSHDHPQDLANLRNGNELIQRAIRCLYEWVKGNVMGRKEEDIDEVIEMILACGVLTTIRKLMVKWKSLEEKNLDTFNDNDNIVVNRVNVLFSYCFSFFALLALKSEVGRVSVAVGNEKDKTVEEHMKSFIVKEAVDRFKKGSRRVAISCALLMRSLSRSIRCLRTILTDLKILQAIKERLKSEHCIILRTLLMATTANLFLPFSPMRPFCDGSDGSKEVKPCDISDNDPQAEEDLKFIIYLVEDIVHNANNRKYNSEVAYEIEVINTLRNLSYMPSDRLRGKLCQQLSKDFHSETTLLKLLSHPIPEIQISTAGVIRNLLAGVDAPTQFFLFFPRSLVINLLYTCSNNDSLFINALHACSNAAARDTQFQSLCADQSPTHRESPLSICVSLLKTTSDPLILSAALKFCINMIKKDKNESTAKEFSSIFDPEMDFDSSDSDASTSSQCSAAKILTSSNIAGFLAEVQKKNAKNQLDLEIIYSAQRLQELLGEYVDK